ncbi:MAG TPA: glycoside hydrolase family 2 TIM barrel-domain containing protein, partial [Phormidium sp.]
LYFEAVNQVADVFVNGKLACHHEGGYSAFACEVTNLVNFGADAGGNTIAIKADNSFNENIAPLSADFTFYGGIYRDVWLIATEPLHINVLDFASPGIYIDTPTVSEERATVRIRGTVVNSTAENKQVRVKNTITDARGKTVASLESSVNVPANGKTTFEQLSESINNPQLWSTDNPYLYTVATNIYDGDSVVDIVENPLGFRWFSFDAEKGFFLNGKPLKLQGTNRHQDYKGMGNAVSNEIHRSDLQMIKDMGANFLRLAHYPQDPVVLQTADQLGLIIWEEIPLVNYITPSQAFTETSKVMLTEMIRQHYNHPSVLMWGYMNEIFLKGPEKTPEYQQKTLKLAQILEKLLRQEDPTRTSVMAMHRIPLYNEAGIADVPQVVGWNIYAGWYSGVFTDFGKFLDDQHEKFPNRPIIVSEYGADSDSRLHSLNPQRRDFTAEYQRRLHESYLQQIEARAFVAGSSLWNQFD